MLIQAYTKNWIEDFNQISKVINNALAHLNISIEHVGSTAVPELAAKPIIDIDIAFRKDVGFDDVKKGLEKIGYYHNGNQGIPNRHVFKRGKTAALHGVLDTIVHHLYVCPIDSEEVEKHILFRDYLRTNEDARVQYQNLKYAIAEEVKQDRKKYAEVKEVKASAFINAIIEKARFKFRM
jgi:GrpB-like predicted nucleotidyltransferase (UPF0157 family)